MTLGSPDETDMAELTVSLNVSDWSVIMAGLDMIQKKLAGQIDEDGIDIAGIAEDTYVKLKTRLKTAPVRSGWDFVARD